VLVPPLLVKMSSVSWRLIRYYQRSEAYRRKGPPNRVLRILGPALLADALVLPHLVGHARGLRHVAFSDWVHRSRQAVSGSMVRQLIVLASLGAAGCSPGAFSRHFATKTDLLAAVTQERLPNLRDQLGDLLGRVGSSSVERNLEHIVQATQRFVAELVPIVTAVGADRELRAGWRRAFDGG
jgi:hypothetical protein